MKTEIQIVPYGEILSSLPSSRLKTLSRKARIARSLKRAPQTQHSVFVAFSRDLDKSFIDLFRQKATQDTKLLILNEGLSTDTLLSRILALPVRTPERLYVLERSRGSGKAHFAVFLFSVLQRLASGLEADETEERILDARIENGVLRVISPRFERLDVPLTEIPVLAKHDPSKVGAFKIDEDGAFLYWPQLDVHLGWIQLQQAVCPKAALKASQKSQQFNKRYGKAVQFLRAQAGLSRSEIAGISEKQLGRIENGECRLTSNAIEALAKAHRLSPNEYMKKLASVAEVKNNRYR